MRVRAKRVLERALKGTKVVQGMREGMTLHDASLAAGYAASSGGFKALVAACRDMPKDDVEAYRLQLRREADEVRAVLLERISEGAPSRDLADLSRALATVWTRLARMLGCDAPDRVEARVTHDLPEDVDALRARLLKILEGAHGDATATADHGPQDGAGGPPAHPGDVDPNKPIGGPVGPDPDA